MTLFLTKKLDFKKWMWLLPLVTLIGLLTFSKSFMLITAVTYFIFVVLAFIKSNNKKTYLVWLIIGVVVVGILAIVFKEYFEKMMIRFFNGDKSSANLNTITTGRLAIWELYIDKCFNSPLHALFGYGITVDSACKYTPHNLYLSMLYRFGIVGILCIIALFVYVFRKCGLNKNLYNYIPLGILLTNCIFEDITSGLFTCLPLLIAFCFVRGLKKDNQN